MAVTAKDIMKRIQEEDIKMVDFKIVDISGQFRHVTVPAANFTEETMTSGIGFDASNYGYAVVEKSDMVYIPDLETAMIDPFCEIKTLSMIGNAMIVDYPANRPLAQYPRNIVLAAEKYMRDSGIADTMMILPEFEFYLFNTDEKGYPTTEPFDRAGYMDVAPEDKGENVRREICMTLLDMGITPESSHHEEGPGQNEIDFRYSDAMTAADDAMNFLTVVKAAAQRNGLFADFSPKPLKGESGNGLHVNISLKCNDGADRTNEFMAGILAHIKEMTAFLNPTEESYKRLGEKKAPKYVTWSPENRSQLIRVPAAKGEYKRIELRSPDPTVNPYLAYALLIRAGLDGIEKNMQIPEAVNVNLYKADKILTDKLETLPSTLAEAKEIARNSDFIQNILGANVTDFLSL